MADQNSQNDQAARDAAERKRQKAISNMFKTVGDYLPIPGSVEQRPFQRVNNRLLNVLNRTKKGNQK